MAAGKGMSFPPDKSDSFAPHWAISHVNKAFLAMKWNGVWVISAAAGDVDASRAEEGEADVLDYFFQLRAGCAIGDDVQVARYPRSLHADGNHRSTQQHRMDPRI